jgi:hypothetical protein
MSTAYDHPQISERNERNEETTPFDKRFSNSLFSEMSQSQLSSARDLLPEMTNEYRLTKLRESKQFQLDKQGLGRGTQFEDNETASMTHTTKSMAGGPEQKFIQPPPIQKQAKRKVSTKKLRLGEKQASKDLTDKQMNLTQLNQVSLNYANQLNASQNAI